MALQLRPDGTLIAVAGVSRSGKTLWTSQQVRAARHLLVWDIKNGEWGTRHNCKRLATLADVRALAKNPRAGRFAFYTPVGMRAQFDTFCALAWVWLRLTGGTLIVEETASVTSPGKAPEAWGDICRQAMGFGCDVYAITQRPAESDKTALGNALLVHCGMMGTPRDRITMAEYLDVSAAEVAALRPLEYIERDRRTHEVRRGVVAVPRQRPRIARASLASVGGKLDREPEQAPENAARPSASVEPPRSAAAPKPARRDLWDL